MSEFAPFFIGWPMLIFVVFSFKAMNYYFNKKKLKDLNSIDHLPTLKDIGLASNGIFVYNGLAYWMENGKVYRAAHQDVVHVNTKTAVDPLNQKEVDIQEYMEILEKLESIQK